DLRVRPVPFFHYGCPDHESGRPRNSVPIHNVDCDAYIDASVVGAHGCAPSGLGRSRRYPNGHNGFPHTTVASTLSCNRPPFTWIVPSSISWLIAVRNASSKSTAVSPIRSRANPFCEWQHSTYSSSVGVQGSDPVRVRPSVRNN